MGAAVMRGLARSFTNGGFKRGRHLRGKSEDTVGQVVTAEMIPFVASWEGRGAGDAGSC